jgi:peptide/nickel transport system substrate-binding protein
MKRSKMFVFLSLIVLFSMALSACGQATTVAPTAVPDELLWNLKRKQAVAAAIDREAIIDRVFEGANIPAYGMIPEGYPYTNNYFPFLDKYGTRNLELAKQLLTEEGFTAEKKFKIELWFPPEHYGTTSADVMQVLKEQLEETGLMEVTLRDQSWAEYVDSLVAGELPFFMLGWFPDFVDPDTWLSPFASCIQSPDNGAFYCDPKMDQLLTDAASASDAAARTTLYDQVQPYYAEQAPTIPLWWEPEFITYRNGVENIKIGPPFVFSYNVLSFAEGYVPASGSTDTIIIGTTDAVNSLDPDDSYSTHDWEILKNTGATLLDYVPGTSELQPAVAVDFPTVSADGKTYTFKIREGIKYADGTPLTAQDYVRSWERLNTLEGQVSGLMQIYIESVTAPDDFTVVYQLKNSYGFFPALVATAPLVPANPNIYPAGEILQFPELIDSIGAYRMTSHVVGDQMVLEANANYFGADKPVIKKVIIKYFADPTTMGAAIEKGEIDIAWRILGPVEANRLKGVAGLTVETINAPTLRYLVFNHEFMAPAQP